MHLKKEIFSYFLGWVLLLLPQILGAAANGQETTPNNPGPTGNQQPNNNQSIKVSGPTQINPIDPAARRQLMLQLFARIVLHKTNYTNQLLDIVTEHGPGPNNYNLNQLYNEIYQLGLLNQQLQTLRDHAQLTPSDIEELISRYGNALQMLE